MEGADDHAVLDGVLVQQSGDWWLRVDGQTALHGPVRNSTTAVAGDRVCAVVAQLGAMYVVWPAGGAAPGPGTGDKNFVYTQGTPATTWSITHGLGKFVAVDVVDSGGSAVIPDVHYVDANTVTLTFGTSTSGKAFVN